ncbi:MAG TPA: hypothetical protein VND21_03605 [Planctomycetota bacterium]|nr:hypothetical protein [Planctomycetota bacterium]
MRSRNMACTGFRRARALLALSALTLLAARPATGTPSFDLYISTGGVRELAVGQTLALRALDPPTTCLPPPYTGTRKAPVPPAAMPIVWSVEPAGLVTISQDGLLTAVGAGAVTVTVACRNPKARECDLTSPGRTRLNIYNELPNGRLPHLAGGPAIESFHLQWDATPFQSRHEFMLSIAGAAFAWGASLRTPATPDAPFPWVLVPEKDRRAFDDEEGSDEKSVARHRASVTAAQLTISSWTDGILSGRLELKTTRGVEFDTTFHARLADRDGVLAKAAARTKESEGGSPAPGAGMR